MISTCLTYNLVKMTYTIWIKIIADGPTTIALFMFVSDPSRQIERQLVSVDNIVIGGLQTLTITPQGPPTAIQLTREIKVECGNEWDSGCITVTTYWEDIYVGTGLNGIFKIDGLGQVTKFERPVRSSHSYIVGLCISNRLLISLNTNGSSQNMFYTSDLVTKMQISSWSHEDVSLSWGSRIVVTQGQLVVADVTHCKLTIYSLAGQLIRHVDCPQISPSSWVCICVSPSKPDVIIVSDYNTSRVFAVNLTTGAVLWTNSDISKPQGIVFYGREHVLVTKECKQTQLWSLDVASGQY